MPCIGWHKGAAALHVVCHVATWLTMCVPCGQADIGRVVAARQLAGDIYNGGVPRGNPLRGTWPSTYVPAQSPVCYSPDTAPDQTAESRS